VTSTTTNLGQWGTEYNEKEDFARVDLKTRALEKPAGQFTMAIEGSPSGGGVLKLMWENTEYSVAFTVQKSGAEASSIGWPPSAFSC